MVSCFFFARTPGERRSQSVMPPCPHFDLKIVQRSKRQSAVAAAAYQSGERLFSEYDQKLHADPSQATAIADEANAKMAKTVTDIYNKLISSLITQQTGDSPLSFQMDPNL
mgnify:CR=1 FL=1